MSIKDIIDTIPKEASQQNEKFNLQQILQNIPEEGYDCNKLYYKKIPVGTRAKDFSGKRIDKLTVLFRVNILNPKKQTTYWLCLCDCGNIIIRQNKVLSDEKSSHNCGCTPRYYPLYAEDLSGKTFGYWYVLCRDMENITPVHWICQCKCGIIKSVLGSNLTREKTKSCGCERRNRTIDFTNRILGYLTVIKQVKKEENYIQSNNLWLCKCICGKEVVLSTAQLRFKTSCGCKRYEIAAMKNMKDRRGERSGLLTILEPIKFPDKLGIFWKCLCDCGNVVLIPASSFSNSHPTQSCGCITSKGETLIKKILTENNIPFESQKTYESCRFPKTNRLAKFDFYINNKFLLEFDGPQHSITKPRGYFTEDNLKTIKERDDYKNEWAKENNIPLKRIPYKELKNLNLDLILNEEYFIN